MDKFIHNPPVNLPKLERIEISGKRHYITPDGVMPSVTTILSALPNPAIEKWKKRVGPEEANRISKLATIRGTDLHSISERYLNNVANPAQNFQPVAKEMFLSIRPFLDKINDIHYQEAYLWSKTLQAAGACDVIGSYDDILSVIDFKTSKRIKKKEDILSYYVQCSMYVIMYQEMTGIKINQIVLIIAVDNEPAQIFIEKPINYVKDVLHAINNWKSLNG